MCVIVGFGGVKWGAASGKEETELFVLQTSNSLTLRAAHLAGHCVLRVV